MMVGLTIATAEAEANMTAIFKWNNIFSIVYKV